VTILLTVSSVFGFALCADTGSIGAQDYVDNLGGKQFWVWSYQGPHIKVNESKMGSPTTGDVGKQLVAGKRGSADLQQDLRRLSFQLRFSRSQRPSDGHQQEAELSFANSRQDLNVDLITASWASVRVALSSGAAATRTTHRMHPLTTTSTTPPR
jgi:hypothetical protein